jgi:hypothetical protein
MAKWKSAVIVYDENRDDADETVSQMKRLGHEEVHVFASPLVRINKQRDIVVHQTEAWLDEYTLWRDTVKTMAKTYASSIDLFLLARPGVSIWEQLPTYAEYTIDTGMVGVWSPFTPNRVFPDELQERPSCGMTFGWCPTYLNSSFTANHCLIASRHAMALMSAYLPKKYEFDQNAAAGLALAMQRYSVPFFFHTPSLVGHKDHKVFAGDFVGCSFEMSQADMRDPGKAYVTLP